MNTQSFKVIIGVMGCITNEKYMLQIKKINETWGKNVSKFVKVLFFLGEEKLNTQEFNGEEYIYLNGVLNDYLSASDKQNLGLKYIHDNYNCDFSLIVGSDSFVNIPKLLLFLENYNSEDKLYIGGHGCNRVIGNKNYYFHSGAGIILSSLALKQLYPYLSNLLNEWTTICKNNNVHYLIVACDVAISYYIQEYTDIQIIKSTNSSFRSCNHTGYPCHQMNNNVNDIIVCHLMSLKDMDDFNNILLSNNYFI
jgi:hypothetical protein